MTRLLTLVIAAVVAVFGAACGSAETAGQGAVAPCGGEQPPAPRWRCAFDDEFTGPRLNTRHWRVVRSAVTGFRAGGECLLGGRHVAVGDGALSLTMTVQQPPVTCGSTSSFYASGMVSTYRMFAQRYGRFAVRARMAAGQGVQSAIWLMPETSAYGPWPRSGEIDLAESYGNTPDAVAPHVHYLDAMGTPAAPGTRCTVSGAATGFHTYVLDWSPSAISMTYDGRPCWTLREWTPAAPLQPPAPFDEPFYVNLTLAVGSAATPWNLPGADTPREASMAVDYVRVWTAP